MKSLSDYATKMKRDWNERAQANAKWFINTFKTEQTEEEFSTSCLNDIQWNVLGVLEGLTWGRSARQLRLLEIGCGIGRMTAHLAEIFGEVHALDVSGEMVRQGRERLKHLPNVHFHEGNGVNFDLFPEGHFDVIFSAYVFQHIPDYEAICSNIRDAYRVLAPGGVFRFMAADVTNAEYLATPKDTWSGAPFSAADSRRLARELGAQLVSLHGAGTQYFWTMLRKPQPAQAADGPLQLLAAGRADDLRVREIPTRGEHAVLTLHLAGLAADRVDCNNLHVEWQGQHSQPFFVAPIRLGERLAMEIKTHVPAELDSGVTTVRLVLPDGQGLTTNVTIVPAPIPPPLLSQFHNAADAGTDIYASGPKSVIRAYITGVQGNVQTDNTLIHIGEMALQPEAVTFIPGNGSWEIKAQLPAGTLAQQTIISVSHCGRRSLTQPLIIQDQATNE